MCRKRLMLVAVFLAVSASCSEKRQAVIEQQADLPPRNANRATDSLPAATSKAVHLFLIEDGERYGYIDNVGRVVIKPQFYAAYQFSEGLAGVKVAKADKYGYIDTAGKMVISPKFDRAAPFSEGFGFALLGSRSMCIDRFEKLLGPDAINCLYFSDGLAMVEVEGKVGFMDQAGKMVIKPQFDPRGTQPFSSGLAQAELGRRRGYVNKTGNFVWSRND
jgi:hypothetical protein